MIPKFDSSFNKGEVQKIADMALNSIEHRIKRQTTKISKEILDSLRNRICNKISEISNKSAFNIVLITSQEINEILKIYELSAIISHYQVELCTVERELELKECNGNYMFSTIRFLLKTVGGNILMQVRPTASKTKVSLCKL